MAKHSIEKSRRQYNSLVATENLEDYALRYSPSSFRKWSPLLLANTALGSISFLALEAIGAVLFLNFGFSNAVWAITLASIIILLAGVPISYYAARYNIDIDLLTRSAGFGYVGSTITSLIYASFCFIFFALEAAIMAQALLLYIDLPLYLGYILCSLIIIPIVFYGITAINRLHRWTQPFWLVLMLVPFYFVLTGEPRAIEFLIDYTGSISGSNAFDPYYFGIATGISFALIAQIGEQVDYLRFMPDKHKDNRFIWWFSMLAAGPGWIVLGFLKQIGGVLLASVVILSGLAIAQAKEPVQMYYIAYTYVFENPGLALTVSTFFVIISQIKINVTNAYAGSLAWSNFFSRVTHAHPGRVVWLVFNIVIALLIMEMGVFDALQKVLGLYSNVAIAWIAAVVADLVINKPLKLSPPIVEFKRAHLYDYNPVGFVSMAVGSVISIIAFTGVFGLYAQAYSWLIALVISFVLSPVIAKITKGKYYIARQNEHFVNSDQLCTCGVCEQQYAQTDFAHCPYHDASICSLCCTLDSSCKDQCKPPQPSFSRDAVSNVLALILRNNVSNQARARIARFILVLGGMLGIVATTFWLTISVSMESVDAPVHTATFYNLFFVLAALISIAAWWVVLGQESQALAETELNEQNEELEQEIIGRQQVEAALKEKEERLALATIHNGVGVWDLNLQTFDLVWDDSMFALYNIKREDFSGAYDAWERSLYPDDRVRGDQEIQEAISGKKPFDTEFRIIWPNGEIRHIKAVANVIRGNDGIALRMLGINFDITKEKQIEQALRESQTQISAFYELDLVGLTITSLEKGWIRINDYLCKMLEYSEQELRNMTWAQFTHPDDLDADAEQFNRLIANEIEGYSLEKRFISKTGKVIPTQLVMRCVRKVDGSVDYFIAMIENISKRKAAETKLLLYKEHLEEEVKTRTADLILARDSAESANKAKSEFLSSMSHELRTPLNAILGFSQLLMFDEHEPLTDEQRENTEQIMLGGEHLLELVNDVLDLAKIESEKAELVFQVVDVNQLLKETLTLVQPIIDRYNVKIDSVCFCEQTTDLKIHADYIRTKQVLLNLISNAAKYNKKDGEIKLKCSRENEGMLRITIIDNGDGISLEKQKELFKPFSRLGAENSNIEGTGIGLVVCKKLVESMHGVIGFESEVGQGASFWFELPLSTEEAAGYKEVKQEQDNFEISGTVLYIEDNPANLKLIGTLVSRIEGLDLITAETAEEGLTLAEDKQPDIILMDINLPGMSGIEAVKCLKSNLKTSNIPVVALSAAATTDDMKNSKNVGFEKYLTKPIDIQKTLECIHGILKDNT